MDVINYLSIHCPIVYLILFFPYSNFFLVIYNGYCFHHVNEVNKNGVMSNGVNGVKIVVKSEVEALVTLAVHKPHSSLLIH